MFGVTIFFFSFWTSVTAVTAATMNLSVLMTGFVFGFSLMYCIVWAKRE